MPILAEPLADAAVTPAALLERVATARKDADRAELLILAAAVEWAHAHPDPDPGAWRAKPMHTNRNGETVDGAPDPRFTTDEDMEWFGIPPIRWDAPAAFAAANDMSTRAGRAYIRDALVLAHRLPLTWQRTQAGDVPVWRARRIAQAVLGAPADVVAHIDAHVAQIAHKVGPITLDRLLEEAMLTLYPEQVEERRAEALSSRKVTFDARDAESTGMAEIFIRGDYKDLFDFDQTISDIAARLAEHGDPDPYEERRAKAVGVLADPTRAADLLDGTATDESGDAGDAAPGTDRPPTAANRPPRKRAILLLHLAEDALRGATTVGRVDNGGVRPISSQIIREWLGHSDTQITVKPVIDLNTPMPEVDAYHTPERMAEQVRLIDTRCVFPHCDLPARRADLDHIVAFARGGPTKPKNLAPLCRHHHRQKTSCGWSYLRLGPRTYLWTDPHGRRYLRDAQGTYFIPPPERRRRTPDDPKPLRQRRSKAKRTHTATGRPRPRRLTTRAPQRNVGAA